MKPWRDGAGIGKLALAGLASAGIYEALRRASAPFGIDGNESDRSILAFLALMAAAFALHFFATAMLERSTSDQSRSALAVLLLFAALFRIQMLFSEPILERDMYRYVWDGDVGRIGVNPYVIAPAEAAFAAQSSRWQMLKRAAEEMDRAAAGWPAIVRVAGELQSNARMQAVIEWVYYPTVPTVYPPVSQWCFTLFAGWTHGLPAARTAFWFKCGFIVFDLINCGLVAWLCRLCGLPATRCILYAWNPLAIKEIANSGHLDSLATMLMLAGLTSALAFSWRRPALAAVLAGSFLGLSFSAKIFAAIALPVLTCHWVGIAWRCDDRSLRKWRLLAAATAWGTFGVTVAVCFAPYLAARSAAAEPVKLAPLSEWNWQTDALRQDPAESGYALPRRQPWTGLTVFAAIWEINSPAFTLVHANLISDGEYAATAPGEPRPWFVILPDRFRQWLESRWCAARDADGVSGADAGRPALGPACSSFNLARSLLLMVFLAIYSMQCWNCFREADRQLPARVFQSLAWFWLLSPTLNPWYVTWFLPLLPFVAVRAWRWLPAFAMLYYLRFGFESQAWTEGPVLAGWISRLGLPAGVRFFDEAVVFIEFGPWFAWMLWETLRNRRSRGTAAADRSRPA